MHKITPDLLPLATNVAEIELDPMNARTGHALDELARSLDLYGQVKPIVVNAKTKRIEAGNGTFQAIKKLGWSKVAAVMVNHDESEAIGYAIADNRLTDLSHFDEEILLTLLQSLDEPLSVPGVDDGFMAELLESVGGDLLGGDDEDDLIEDEPPIDKAEELLEKWQCKTGDLWLIGDHRLIVGDCTDKATVERLMGGDKAELGFTSPPYNAGSFGYDNGKSKYKVKGGDDLSQQNYFNFLAKFTDLMLDYCNYVLMNNQFLSGNRHALACYFGHYQNQLKDVFYWVKNTAPPNINKGVFTNRVEIILCLEKENTKKGFPVEWQGKYPNVILGNPNSQNELSDIHSAIMPIYVPLHFLEAFDSVKLVYDPFLGSGTTMVAAHQTGRRCYGSEIEPKYAAVILERMSLLGLTPKLAKE